jgi:hypothetical protein
MIHSLLDRYALLPTIPHQKRRRAQFARSAHLAPTLRPVIGKR